MKRLVEEVDDDGFTPFMGQRITLLCMNYFYTGKLVAVNSTFVELADAAIIYETGEWGSKTWKDAQSLPGNVRVMVAAIESFGVWK